MGLLFREHPKAQPGGGFWRSPGSNLRPLFYKESDLTTAPRRVDILYNSVLICFQLFAFQIGPPKPKRKSIIFVLNIKSAFEKIFVFHFKDLLKCIFIFDRRNSFNIKKILSDLIDKENVPIMIFKTIRENDYYLPHYFQGKQLQYRRLYHVLLGLGQQL